MMKISKMSATVLMLTVTLIVGCKKDEMEDAAETFSTDSFSQADLDILTRTLNLTANPYNYANQGLPRHYSGNEEVLETDNLPGNNRVTDMGATLGRVLFYDVNLSANKTISCASCHQQSNGFADTERFSSGLDGQQTRRNTMTLINSRYYNIGRFGWDERASSLEEFVLLPIKDHVEMGMELPALEARLRQLEYYPVLFRNAFGSESITSEGIAKALSQYVRSIVSFNSKYDEGLRLTNYSGPDDEMPTFPNFTAKESLGRDIFFSDTEHQANCFYCHFTPAFVAPGGGNVNLEDDFAKNNGLDLVYADKGRGEITGNPSENGKFKVPSLKNIALTAPYMHDGRFQTLEEVVDHYSNGVVQHPNLHFRLSIVDDGPQGGIPAKQNFTAAEKEALIAFLNTLTDPVITTDEKFSDPFLP
jgi:cytochrome c peroxidase